MRFADLLKVVADRHGVAVDDLKGPSSRRREAWPRQEAMALGYRLTPLTLSGIGRQLGGRNHATVLHGIRRHEERSAEVGR